MFSVQIAAGTPDTLTEAYCGFHQTFQVNEAQTLLLEQIVSFQIVSTTIFTNHCNVGSIKSLDQSRLMVNHEGNTDDTVISTETTVGGISS
jgi:hypothetical protein